MEFYTISVGGEEDVDVFAPRGQPAGCPVCILIHGGAWVFGNRSNMHPMAKYMQARGIIAVCGQYTKASFWRRRTVVDPLEDMSRLVDWCISGCAEWRSDPSKVFVVGHSAGAQLAAMQSSKVRAVVCLAGVFGPNRALSTGWGAILRRFVFDTARGRFPVQQIRPSTAPHLLVVSQLEFGLKSETYDYYHALREAGVPVRVANVRGDHMSIAHDPIVFQLVVQFISAKP